MKRHTMALALWTLSSTSCAKPEIPRAIAVLPDPAKLADCPKTFPAAPALAPLSTFTLADGRAVVLLSTVIARETATVKYILLGRGAWHICESSVAYVQDWSKRMAP
jgi:hypothetical protein